MTIEDAFDQLFSDNLLDLSPNDDPFFGEDLSDEIDDDLMIEDLDLEIEPFGQPFLEGPHHLNLVPHSFPLGPPQGFPQAPFAGRQHMMMGRRNLASKESQKTEHPHHGKYHHGQKGGQKRFARMTRLLRVICPLTFIGAIVLHLVNLNKHKNAVK